MTSYRRAAALLALVLLVSCRKKEAQPPPGAAPGDTSVAAPTSTLPPRPGPVFPTPPAEPAGTISEVRVAAGGSPAQVIATLPGRTSADASEADCGSGPSAKLQCVDLVIAGIPKTARFPKAAVYAKKRNGPAFIGPCAEVAFAVDCATTLGEPVAIQMVGKKPKLEVTKAGFSLRWRAINMASEPLDVKVVVSF